ncbi:MAG TPA: DnaA/Hda family protein [bacterium]
MGAKQQTLSTVLTEKKVISEEQYAQACDYQKQHSVSLDQALMDLNILAQEDLIALYRDVLQVHFLKLEDVEIDREAVRHVPASVAHRHHLIPVRRSGNSLAVAMTDPTDPQAMAALRSVTDFEIIPFVGRYDAIEHALYVHYGDPANATDAADVSPGDHVIRARALLEDERIGQVGKSVQLNRSQTFDSFVADTANEFPLNVARSISDLHGDEEYNPFHCWGAEGCGKSHLLQAIANHVLAHSPLKRCVLTSGQRFVDELFASIRDKKVNFFRYLYGELDLLLIDDAEALLTRDWAQRELGETFRNLQRKGKRLVVASRHNLATEPRLIPDLRVALESGVIAGFSAYSVLARMDIARRHANGVDLKDDVLSELVARSNTSQRDLLDLLQQVTVMAALSQKEVTVELVRDLINLCGKVAAETPADRARTLFDLSPLGGAKNSL